MFCMFRVVVHRRFDLAFSEGFREFLSQYDRFCFSEACGFEFWNRDADSVLY